MSHLRQHRMGTRSHIPGDKDRGWPCSQEWLVQEHLHRALGNRGEMLLCFGLQMGSLESPTTHGTAAPVTCVPASTLVLCSSWMQLCSSSNARLSPAVKEWRFCRWDMACQGLGTGSRVEGQAVRRRRMRRRAVPGQSREYRGQQVKAEEGVWMAPGSQAGGGCAQSSHFHSPLLGIPVTFPGMFMRQGSHGGDRGAGRGLRRW